MNKNEHEYFDNIDGEDRWFQKCSAIYKQFKPIWELVFVRKRRYWNVDMVEGYFLKECIAFQQNYQTFVVIKSFIVNWKLYFRHYLHQTNFNITNNIIV